MFGTFRFMLAALVALSHFGIIYAGFNPGQWSVVSFYMLSGLLMERQFKKLGSAQAFYLDRFLRIYPVYFVVLLLAFFVGAETTWPEKIANLSLLSLNYNRFTGVPILVGPAWSLACESHFYLLVPFLVACSTKILRGVLAASLALFATSPWLPDNGFWAYTALPGILFVFLSGILINRKDFTFIKIIWGIAAVLLGFYGCGKWLHTSLPSGININVCLGYLAATLIIPALDRFSPKARWDRFLGLFSYPLFLCHQPVAMLLDRFSFHFNALILLLMAVGFSLVLILMVEIPFDRVRYAMRKKTNQFLRGSEPSVESDAFTQPPNKF